MAEHLVVEHEQEAPGGQESGHRLLQRVPGTSIDPTRAGREKETQMEIHKVGLRVMAAAEKPLAFRPSEKPSYSLSSTSRFFLPMAFRRMSARASE